MIAEREFAGFVLPFAAGIFIATGIGFISITHNSAASAASLMLVSALLLSMAHPERKSLGSGAAWSVLAVLGLCTGAFTGFTSVIMDIGPSETAAGIRAAASGHRMGEAIDRLPFRERQTNAMIKALTTGERSGIPESVTEAFRDSGASHILSLSGFHLGIIYGIIRWSLSWLGNSQKATRMRSAATIISCGLYTLATGAGASIVRAFLFILLGESARLLHRRQTTASLLMSALVIQLTISPGSIRSVSFQLSYAAMAGIAYIYPRLRNFWPGNPEDDRPLTKGMRRVWNSAAMSISCQLTTGPLAYMYFGSFPMHFLLTNLIALPLTSLIIPLGLIVLILNNIGICPKFLAEATDILVEALVTALEIISDM